MAPPTPPPMFHRLSSPPPQRLGKYTRGLSFYPALPFGPWVMSFGILIQTKSSFWPTPYPARWVAGMDRDGTFADYRPCPDGTRLFVLSDGEEYNSDCSRSPAVHASHIWAD